MKTFTIHYRYRDDRNELQDVFENVETASQQKAKDYGKRIAEERAQSYAGKYWFMSVLPCLLNTHTLETVTPL